MIFRSLALLLFLNALIAFTACNDDKKASQPVTIAIEAILGDQEFQSGVCVDGIGREGQSLNVSDLRFYVSNVEAKSVNGDWAPLALSTRSWQGNGVTLIDLADTETESATVGLNNYIEGTLPEGHYDQLRFTLGVPFELNHSDFNVAEAPLNVGGMAWSWLGGRKFLRLDATPCGDSAENTDLNGVSLHIGSTECQGDIPDIQGCDKPNRSEITVDWTPGDNLTFDLDALFENTDVYETRSLCMTDPSVDPDCAPIFTALGIPFDNQSPAQRVFSSTDREIHAHATGDANEGDHGEDDHEHHDHH